MVRALTTTAAAEGEQQDRDFAIRTADIRRMKRIFYVTSRMGPVLTELKTQNCLQNPISGGRISGGYP